jgi:hypothetical protein
MKGLSYTSSEGSQNKKASSGFGARSRPGGRSSDALAASELSWARNGSLSRNEVNIPDGKRSLGQQRVHPG